jgi:DNA-binding GntR family transcriptional regulator
VLALPEPAHAAAATTPQRISQAMTTAIVERRLMPGTKLVEQQIADIFQVSRTVVRQALNQLASDRLVALSPARGAFVCTPSVQVARRVFEVLAELLSRCSAAMPTPRWR